MTEAKVSSKTPTTTAKKSKGDKERDVIARIRDLLPQWEIQKVEAFCAEHGHDLDKIHQALDGSFEATGHQPDDWQVMTKKEQKPKRGGRTDGGSREPRENPRPREDRPRGERGGRGRGGGESRGGGRGRGGGDRRGGRGGGATRSQENITPATADATFSATSEPVADTWALAADAPQPNGKPDNTAEWGASSSPIASTPLASAVAPVASPSPRVEPTAEPKMTWAQKFSANNARKAKVTEFQSAEAFPSQSQQVLGPAVVHVQPPPQTGPSYRAALQGNSRWGKKPEPIIESAADTAMVPIEQQTASLAIDSFQQADSYTQAHDNTSQNTSSDALDSTSGAQETATSFPQAEVFQPEPSFQSQPQAESFQIYQSSQNQPSVENAVSDSKAQQTQPVFVQSVSSPSDFNDLRTPQSFSSDNGKLVIDLLSATNSVILPHASQEPLSYEIQFGSFGQPAQSTTFSPVQPEPVQQPEPAPAAISQQSQSQQQPQQSQQQQSIIEQTPTESQPPFVSTLREDSLPTKQAATDNSGSQFPTQNQFYQSQNQQAPPPSQSQSQSQPASSYRGPPSGSYDPHYAYPFPYESASPYYNDFASRDTQPQSYQNYNDQYSSQFRGGTTGGSGGSRTRPTNTNQPYYPSPTARGALLSGNGATDGSTGGASPPTSEPVSPNSAKSASFSKPTAFTASKPSFNNATTKIPPQIPNYTAKPAAPASGYNKPPSTTTQPPQKSFKPPAQSQGSQSQHHPDAQHYAMYPPGVYAGYPYPYPYQPPGQPMPPGFMHPQMPYAPYDPRYSYPYPGPVQPFEGEYEYSKPPAHYSEGGTTPRGAAEWSGNTDGQKASNSAAVPSANTSSTNTLSSMNSTKNTVAPGATKKPARFEYAEQDPHFNSGYGFPGAPASSPMAMHAAAAPYQPTNYGQPILHAMGGQAPYGGGQYDTHPRGYAAGGSWQ